MTLQQAPQQLQQLQQQLHAAQQALQQELQEAQELEQELQQLQQAQVQQATAPTQALTAIALAQGVGGAPDTAAPPGSSLQLPLPAGGAAFQLGPAGFRRFGLALGPVRRPIWVSGAGAVWW